MNAAVNKITSLLFSKNHIHGKNKKSSDKKSLKILIITPYAPYPVYTGGASRIYEKIKYFGARHHLTVASLYNTNEQKKGLIKILSPHTVKLILVERKKPYLIMREKIPDNILKVTTKKMYKTLKKYAYSFDIIMFEHIYTACYRDIFKSGLKILEEHNIESNILYQSDKVFVNDSHKYKYDNKEKADLLYAFETKNWPLFDLRTTVSNEDKKLMQSRCDGEIYTIANGVNFDNIEPVECNNISSSKILFMGHLSYWPNIQGIKYYLNEIHPLIIRQDDKIKLCIAGRNPDEEIIELTNRNNIECIADPLDMYNIAKNCILTIVPLLSGGGTRIKIIHSMAMGLPVVTTSLGSQGLGVENRKHILINDDPASFANSILEVINDPELRRKLIDNGLAYVRDNHDYSKIFENYENLLLNETYSC